MVKTSLFEIIITILSAVLVILMVKYWMMFG